jgi:arginyl-tRNA synthetase
MGHLRNNFLGWSVAQVLKYAGFQIYKTCISNDRGIHICKSMVAWQLFGNGATPESTGIKGDHFVGDYYVLFGTEHKKQMAELTANGLSKEEAEKQAPIIKAAQQMLVNWENGVPEVIDLWKKMNQWVYQGFDVTYNRIGSDFDKTYYESDTYLLGKKAVEQNETIVGQNKENHAVMTNVQRQTNGLTAKLVDSGTKEGHERGMAEQRAMQQKAKARAKSAQAQAQIQAMPAQAAIMKEQAVQAKAGMGQQQPQGQGPGPGAPPPAPVGP